MASPVLGMPVSQPPADGITRVRWSRGGRLLVTSWDEVRCCCRHATQVHVIEASMMSMQSLMGRCLPAISADCANI
jgi:hypothetical protein